MFVIPATDDPQCGSGNIVLVHLPGCCGWPRGAYCWGICPPISLWGGSSRCGGSSLTTRLPRAQPAAITGAGIACGGREKRPSKSVPVTLALLFIVTLTSAPTLERWRLTGKHRLSPATLMANKKAEVTQV
jgi:hypothetical protein